MRGHCAAVVGRLFGPLTLALSRRGRGDLKDALPREPKFVPNSIAEDAWVGHAAELAEGTVFS